MSSVNERGRNEQREVEYVEKSETKKQDERLEQVSSKALGGKKVTYNPSSSDTESSIFSKVKHQK